MQKYQYDVVQRQSDRNWEITWRQDGKARYASTGTKDAALAKVFLETFKKIHQPKDVVTIGDILQQYTIKWYQPRAVKMNRHNSIIKALDPLSDCDPLDHEAFEEAIWEWKQERMFKVKESAMARELAVMIAALNWANDRERGRMIKGVPYIPKNKYEKTYRVRWLDADERERLLDALPSVPLYLRLAIGIAISTAARKTSILELQKRQIKLREGQIDFQAPADGKRRKARRVCDITDLVRPWLEEAMAVTQTGYIIERNGTPMPNFYDDYQRFIKSIDIENFTFHDLRSTWAAGAALDGVPMSQIQAALGHSSVLITEKHYAQIHPEYREKAREYSKKTYKSRMSHME